MRRQPDTAKRVAQELIVNDKVAILGAGITPSALRHRPSGHRGENSHCRDAGGRLRHRRALALYGPHELYTRASVGSNRRLGGEEWRQEGRHLVSDYAPGLEAEAIFKERAVKGGVILSS